MCRLLPYDSAVSQTDITVARIENLLRRLRRLGLLALVTLAILWAIWSLLRASVAIEVHRLWFGALHLGGVYSTILGTQVLLLVLFGAVAGLVTGGSFVAVRRFRPRVGADEKAQKLLWRFQQQEPRWRWVLLGLVTLVPAAVTGWRAAGAWQTWLLWRNATPWGQTDPQFHRDISYYVDVYPLHRLVVTLLMSIVTYALVITLVGAYAYSGLRIFSRGQRVTRPVKVQLSVLVAAYLLLLASGWWLDRLALSTAQDGVVTGLSYTDIHAVAPGKLILMALALLAVLVLLGNLYLRRARYIVLPVVGLMAAALVVGSAWPVLVHRLTAQPSASTVELPYIARNQRATLAAFGLDGQVSNVSYGSTVLNGSALTQQAERTAQIRLLDPGRVSPTFNVKQQLQAYYGFKSPLDVDSYSLGGSSRDVVIAVRGLRMSGISRPTWDNEHLVYTHGYGVVAAPTDEVNPKSDVPVFLDGGMPPAQQVPLTQPRVYYGPSLPSYSIVGQPKGSTTQLEFDHPGVVGSTSASLTTYDGNGGVPMGSAYRRLLFAVQEGSLNVLTSQDVNSASRIVMLRNPRARVAAVAPWLTLDGDVYPAVVDGRVDWVVDGYTASSTYPESQLVNLGSATASTLTTSGSTVRQPNENVNYLRNSVKAVVDAYTGQVTLYEWNQSNLPDPLLKTWESAFPGLVKPQADIPAALLSHLRYPQDLFDVQRSLLTRYHVSGAAGFYSGTDFWKIPTDPTVAATKQLNSGQTATPATSAPAQPSVYMSLSPDGFGSARFSLSTSMVTLNRRNLAAFLSVDSVPGPDYGRFTLVRFPTGNAVEAPDQVQNDIESDTAISEALTLQRGGNSKVVLGNLLAIPLGGRMLYVEPIYTQAAGSTSFPILRHIVAIYGNGQPAFDTNLSAALRQAVTLGDSG